MPIGAGFPPARDGGSLGGAQAGPSPTGVFDTCKRFVGRGAAGLRTGPRGPEPGHGRFLDAEQETEARDLIRRRTSDGLDLPFALWSRAAVRELVLRRFGVRLAVRSMGTHLARWGFTARKPLRRAYEQDPAAVRRWLRRDYPASAARAKAENGAVFRGDETGLRSDDVRGRSYAPRGRTPTVRVPHKRAGRKVFLILDRLPVHRSGAVRAWLAGREAEIEVFHLPPYSPELNPDEGVNADLKQTVTRTAPTRSKQQLKRALVGHMRRLSKSPHRVRRFFGHRTFRYAA